MLRLAPRALALSCLGLLVFAGAASAQRAPIVYAGQGGAATQTASASDRLEGGSETSYGYGSSDRRRSGAVIDLRRPPSGAARVTPVADQQSEPLPAPPSADQSEGQGEEGAQPWLERERVGPPYQANGRWYVPTPEPGYEQTGTASWYGPQFHGRRTASGEPFDETAFTAAHPTLPIPSLVQVTNLENGREVIVRVNDRGPFVGERLIDLSRGAAQVLGFEAAGHARVHVRYLGPAPRRVNADGSPAPASAPSSAPMQPATVEEEGPTSLLPPSSASPETELAGAPVENVRPVASYAAPGAGGHYLQVGAFSDLANAHRVRDAVGAAGPVVVDVRHSASGGELFRVRVGPWNSAEEAEAARRQLAALGYGETIVAAR
ncbi:MAG TPA: septal ring lytic transglycosylase RlpA family protein [Vitreimonas sp.]|nr:septal ring lytic transglycosylase RlpA family protein [Vitreimonas sp.]